MADRKDDIESYHRGTLSERERHALEKKALSDPFLADALEKSEHISSEDFSADIGELSKKIERRRSTWFTPLRLAASVLFLVGAGSFFYYFTLPEPATFALEKSASPGLSSDSVVVPEKDSSSGFLTLAKPDETKKERRKEQELSSSRSTSKSLRQAGKTDIPRETTSSTGAGAEAQPSNLTLAEAEEDKNAAAEAEVIMDEQEKIAPVQEAPAVTLSQQDDRKDQSSLSKKESRAKRAYSPDGSSANQNRQFNQQQITGNVISSDDGVALPGVNVVVKGTNTGTVTDLNGNFEINTEVSNPKLVFSFIGMSTVEAKPADQTPLNVKMKEDASQLSEVVVTGSGIQDSDKAREPVVRSASPAGGLKAYNQYLENNLRYPAEALAQKIKGRVLIEFTVETNGNLSEFNIVKGLGHGCDEEVIRLVKEGPKWSPTTQDDVPVDTQVKVRMKFDPSKAEK